MKEEFVQGVAVTLLIPLMIIGQGVVNSWALGLLWGWYITPVFGIPAPAGVYCYGVSLIATMLTSHYHAEPKEKEDGQGWRVWFSIFIKPIMFVAIGWSARRLFA